MAYDEFDEEEEDVETKPEKVVFDMPPGDADFDEADKGEKLDVRAVIRKEADGKACLVSVAGMTLEGYSDEEETEEVSAEDEFESMPM